MADKILTRAGILTEPSIHYVDETHFFMQGQPVLLKLEDKDDYENSDVYSIVAFKIEKNEKGAYPKYTTKALIKNPAAKGKLVLEVGLDEIIWSTPSRDTFEISFIYYLSDSISIDGDVIKLPKGSEGATTFEISMAMLFKSAKKYYKTKKDEVTKKKINQFIKGYLTGVKVNLDYKKFKLEEMYELVEKSDVKNKMDHMVKIVKDLKQIQEDYKILSIEHDYYLNKAILDCIVISMMNYINMD